MFLRVSSSLAQQAAVGYRYHVIGNTIDNYNNYFIEQYIDNKFPLNQVYLYVTFFQAAISLLPKYSYI